MMEKEIKGEKKSPFDLLKELALSYTYFYTKEGWVFVSISDGGKKVILRVDGEEFKNYLIYNLHKKYDLTLGSDGLSNLLTLLRAYAKNEGELIKTFQRVGKHKGIFFYNLANEAGEIIKVTSKGIKVVQQSPIAFVRSRNTLEQVKPVHDPDIDVWTLKEYFNTASEEDFTLLLIHILSCFIPEISHHVLMLLGNQGSSKSTVSKMIKALVDPSIVDVSTMPKNKEDLVLQLSTEYMVAFDNIGTLRAEYNDIFCQVVTGGNYVKRRLYTDDDIVVHSYKRCLILNGINYLTTQADLLDRSIVVTLKKISSSKRIPEKELLGNFYTNLPYILHSIFKTISKAKKIYRNLEIEKLPRMADVVKWQCAIAEALDINYVDFLDIYNRNRDCINSEIISSNPTANALILLMKDRENWKSSVSELWENMDIIAYQKNMNRSDPLWAKSPSSLSRQLNVLKVNLESIGLVFSIRNIGINKQITIKNRNWRGE